jgi:hypothetical protein
MGALEDYINRVEKESGKWVAYWQLCTLESDYYHKYGRYPSKNELFEYGNSLMRGNSCTRSKTDASINSISSSTSKDSTSQPSEEALKILKSLELSKEKSSDDPVPNVSFNKAYKIWK